jgi:8-hydroxy-5-deazaflavin:NADPH oxidoreductase
MKIGILGTGVVGNTLGTKLVQGGHEVRMGSRSPANEKAVEWTRSAGPNASHGTFAEAAAFGEIVFNCTQGATSIEALELAGRGNLAGKILIDVANPLDFSRGFPPTLTVCNTDSLGERIQRVFPDVKVIKALNTMNCSVMVNPGAVPGDHNLFLCGNDAEARERVAGLLGEWFGWKRENVIDLGDITGARGTEMLLPLWLRLYVKLQNPNFNFHVAVGEPPPKA